MNSDGAPDNWTLTPYSGSAIAISSAVVTNGVNSLEFNTAGASTGGGTATSDKFPVTEGSTVSVSFSFFATNATTTNTFSINWYDEDDALTKHVYSHYACLWFGSYFMDSLSGD